MANRATSVTRLPGTSELVAGLYQEGRGSPRIKKLNANRLSRPLLASRLSICGLRSAVYR